MTITDKLSRLTAINLGTLLDTVLRDNEDYICDLTRNQMYEDGVMNVRTGKHERYAESTKRAKRRAPFNKTEFVTLKWFGEFHESLKILIFKDYFVINSANKTWGNYLEPNPRFENALGLTKESKSELRELVRDELIKKLRREL